MKNSIYNLQNYNFQIPKELIAQEPAIPRDSCRLLIVDRKKAAIAEGIFKDIIDFFKKGDVFVLNNTKVIKARLIGKKISGAKIILLKPGKRARLNDSIIFKDNFKAKIIDKTSQGLRILEFTPKDFRKFLPQTGKVPLPPYIKKDVQNFNDYQTVYAKKEGAVAAPTAGLHFTQELIEELKKRGVKILYVTLHCGLATFRPVKQEDIRNHKLEPEWIEVSSSAAKTINCAKQQGARVIAVGTTAVRTLESLTYINGQNRAQIKPFCGQTDLYIVPGYKFKMINALITNFHTPCSSNLIMVSALAGLDLIKKSYTYASQRNFRFYSFGDAMLIV